MAIHIPHLFLLTKFNYMVVIYMFERLSKLISRLFHKRDEVEGLKSLLDGYKSECISYKLLSIGMEYEFDNEYEIALEYYYEANDKYPNSKARTHIPICLKHLGRIDEAKMMIVKIRPEISAIDSIKIGKLLEEGFWGEPDYYEARKWYMTKAWYAPNNEEVIIARENLKRILKDFSFDDYCHKCGKKILNEPIYFNNSTFSPENEFCSDCIEMAPFIYTLNPLTGEMSRSTYECDWKALANEKGEFPSLNSIIIKDKDSQ